MISIAFPEMFSNNVTNLFYDRDASLSNLKLLLGSDKFSLLGDPYFGTNLKQFVYEQNNTVFRDLLIDEIYVAIKTFMPQIYVTRKDITVTSDHTGVFANINCINKLDNTTNLYIIKLTDSED